jgi:hypothetical protein
VIYFGKVWLNQDFMWHVSIVFLHRLLFEISHTYWNQHIVCANAIILDKGGANGGNDKIMGRSGMMDDLNNIVRWI